MHQQIALECRADGDLHADVGERSATASGSMPRSSRISCGSVRKEPSNRVLITRHRGRSRPARTPSSHARSHASTRRRHRASSAAAHAVRLGQGYSTGIANRRPCQVGSVESNRGRTCAPLGSGRGHGRHPTCRLNRTPRWLLPLACVEKIGFNCILTMGWSSSQHGLTAMRVTSTPGCGGRS